MGQLDQKHQRTQPQCAHLTRSELSLRGPLPTPLPFSSSPCSVQRCSSTDPGPLRRLFPSLCQIATPVLFQLPLSLLKLKVIEVARGCCSFLPRPPSSPRPPQPSLSPPPSPSSRMGCSQPCPTLERLLLGNARSSSGLSSAPWPWPRYPRRPLPCTPEVPATAAAATASEPQGSLLAGIPPAAAATAQPRLTCRQPAGRLLQPSLAAMTATSEQPAVFGQFENAIVGFPAHPPRFACHHSTPVGSQWRSPAALVLQRSI